MLKVNMIPVPDALMSHSTEEEFDKPIILHLWPTVLLRNLLPYPITFKIKVQDTLQSLSTESDLCGLTWHNYYITVKRDAHCNGTILVIWRYQRHLIYLSQLILATKSSDIGYLTVHAHFPYFNMYINFAIISWKSIFQQKNKYNIINIISL